MPLHIEIGKNKIKKHSINMNQYRNWHFQVSNKIKQKYQDLVSKQLKEHKLKRYKKISLDFVIYYGSKRKSDRSNFLSIQEKFFCDALVKMQIIEDDNDMFIESSHYYSGYDKNDPRCEIFINVIE
jgi:hypothetical protein